jgi:phosphoglycerate-specific signal transduction histidine kinase
VHCRGRPNDPRNVGGEPPTNRSADQAALLHELIEALTALGNYLAAAQRDVENQRGVLGEALQGSLSQYQRAAECIRRLRHLFLRDSRSNDDRQGID